MTWAALETPLDPLPEFYVEAPDTRKDWREIDRQASFLQLMRHAAPRVVAYANANAGKRARHVAAKEGIRSGVFDLTVVGQCPNVAWIEFKGYDNSGRAGALSRNQIEFGNRMAALGHPVGCFFSPHRAVDWLRGWGFDIAEIREGAL